MKSFERGFRGTLLTRASGPPGPSPAPPAGSQAPPAPTDQASPPPAVGDPSEILTSDPIGPSTSQARALRPAPSSTRATRISMPAPGRSHMTPEPPTHPAA